MPARLSDGAAWGKRIVAVRVVCISRTLGALGEQVGGLVAERLGFQYVDEQVIERAARLARVDPKLVAEVEHRQPLLRRIKQKLAAARDAVEPATLALAFGPLLVGATERAALRASPEDLRFLIQEAIQEWAEDGKVVILAHASSMTLATRADVVRILVTASAETRAQRLVAAQGITSDEATAAIASSDRDRGDYFRRFHSITEEHPTHYDLVVNTDVLTPDLAAEVVVRAVELKP